jgi:hypothetical protein
MQTNQTPCVRPLHRGSRALVGTGGSWHWFFGLAGISVPTPQGDFTVGIAWPKTTRAVTEESQEFQAGMISVKSSSRQFSKGLIHLRREQQA